MSKKPLLRSAMRLSRVATDTLAALAVFVFILAATSSADRSRAGSVRANDFVGLSDSAREPATRIVDDMPRAAAALAMVSVPDAGSRQVSQHPALFVLAAVFSLLAAANLAFLRHLRRVSVRSPRRKDA